MPASGWMVRRAIRVDDLGGSAGEKSGLAVPEAVHGCPASAGERTVWRAGETVPLLLSPIDFYRILHFIYCYCVSTIGYHVPGSLRVLGISPCAGVSPSAGVPPSAADPPCAGIPPRAEDPPSAGDPPRAADPPSAGVPPLAGGPSTCRGPSVCRGSSLCRGPSVCRGPSACRGSLRAPGTLHWVPPFAGVSPCAETLRVPETRRSETRSAEQPRARGRTVRTTKALNEYRPLAAADRSLARHSVAARLPYRSSFRLRPLSPTN